MEYAEAVASFAVGQVDNTEEYYARFPTGPDTMWRSVTDAFYKRLAGLPVLWSSEGNWVSAADACTVPSEEISLWVTVFAW